MHVKRSVNWGACFLAVAIVGVFGLQAAAAEPDGLPTIEWLSGPTQSTGLERGKLAEAVAELAQKPADRHVLVQFTTPVTPGLRAELDASGLKLLTYLGGNAYFAGFAPAGANGLAISQTASLARVSAIVRPWRLHPLLQTGEPPPWAVVSPIGKGNATPMVGAYVVFHQDVPLEPDGINAVLRHGGIVRSRLETINGLVIELPFGNVGVLADEDIVQWVEPPLPRMEELNDSNRVITGADIVQAPPYGLNGSGVTVLVYDGGFALASHTDFGGRLTVRDSSGLSDHATHVSGTIGGSGAASGGLRRGMAPSVTIQSYGFQYDGSGIFLYSNPGDFEDDYDQAINVFGADISNNSIGTNTCANGFPCSITGDYGVMSAVIDAVVRGSLGTPFRVVWANGNERSCTGCPGEHQAGYHSTAPPACAKNHLTVGALNSNDDSQTSFTSWGPCDDGRLKPDVSAPGCQSNGDGGVTSCSSSGGYNVKCGTSMASPTVCGLSSLLLQDFRAQHPGDPDFRNSTLRAIMAHTAQDRGNAGPDYQFGYGSVRVQAAVDFGRTDNFLEDEVVHGGSYSVLVVVAPGDPQLKITLAWDDAAAAPNVTNALVNDLDLVVLDPSSVQQFPWTLNQATPATPAVRTQADHKNNIEQVFVTAPAPGAWRVEVRGFNVPQGPQPFSLCASPLLVNCSTQGVISLDRVKYACQSTATIQVVDCDLNTDDLVIETASVTIESTTEAAGENVVLTETAPETAAFRGTIALSTTDAAGVLHVADGDAVVARYIDADDGFGGTNVVVEANAVVDCQGPVISNVQTSNVGPFTANVTFSTGEPAAGTVRYGASCAALGQQAAGSGFNTSHTITLTGLMENSTFFFAVDAVDQADNASSDDNGGACYAFATPDVPNYFTEEYGSDNDLDNLSLLFAPDGSFDYYVGCAESISALPVNPAGGTTLTFSPNMDDGAATINLSGGATVSLYGTSFGSFFVGTNGYVTFGVSDTDYDETIAEHFDTRRIAALYDDIHPGQGGSVSWKQLSDRVVVTWLNVPEYNAGNSNTFQIDMGFDGTIRMSYLAVAAGDGITGLSRGTGLPADFFETDLSAMGSCGPRPPVASNVSTQTPLSTPIAITLPGSDDGLPDPPAALSWIVTSLPQHGSLSDPQAAAITTVPYLLVGGGNQVTYSPQLYQGLDSFQFKINDGGVPPEGGDSNTATVSVTVGGPQIAYSFPLDTDPGWTRTGQWGFGQPTGGGSHALDPSSGHTGTNVYGYNLNGDYANNIPVYYLTSRSYDFANLTQSQLKFWRRLGVESATFDHANVQVSNDGVNWVTVWNHTGPAVSESSWTQQTLDVSAVADGQPSVSFRWGMGTTDGSVTYPGWNIDDIEIWAIIPIADCNNNGVPDPQDISGGTSQDCNGNGVPDECEKDLGPVFVTQPVSATVCQGESAAFNVTATGTGALSYQWRRNLVDISGAISASYAINPVQPAHAGSYTVLASDACGSEASNPAVLTVVTVGQCGDGNDCTADGCTGGACTHTPTNGASCDDNEFCTRNDVCAGTLCGGTPVQVPFGDVAPLGGDGIVDINDVLCVLDGFGVAALCLDGDLVPCGGDGVIDLPDILAELDAFSGVDACPDPCP